MKAKFTTTGSWSIGNSRSDYRGDLYLNQSEGGIVLNIHIPNKKNAPMSYFKFPLDIPFISGTTNDGAKITLIDCSRISTKSIIGSEEIYVYQAKFMLQGVNFKKEDEILFSKVKINIPGIIQWGNVSNYVSSSMESTNVLIGLEQVNAIKIYSCDEYTLSYDLSFSFPSTSLMREEIILNQTPYLVIESKLSIKPLKWFVNIALKMKRIIEIAMGRPLGFKTMFAESPEFFWEFGEGQKHLRPIEVTHALTLDKSKRQYIDTTVTETDFLFNLEELSREANFSCWQEIALVMEPIIELYIDDLYNKELSISRHFLNMIQALETYHSRRICSGSLGEYKKRVERITSDRKDDKAEAIDFLLGFSKNWNNKKQVPLRYRIADLILADFKFFFYTGEIHRLDFPKIITYTRNYYTHYSLSLENKALKDEDLVNAYYFLKNSLEFYLLKELGFNEDFIHNRIRKRIEPIRIGIETKATNKN